MRKQLQSFQASRVRPHGSEEERQLCHGFQEEGLTATPDGRWIVGGDQLCQWVLPGPSVLPPGLGSSWLIWTSKQKPRATEKGKGEMGAKEVMTVSLDPMTAYTSMVSVEGMIDFDCILEILFLHDVNYRTWLPSELLRYTKYYKLLCTQDMKIDRNFFLLLGYVYFQIIAFRLPASLPCFLSLNSFIFLIIYHSS